MYATTSAIPATGPGTASVSATVRATTHRQGPGLRASHASDHASATVSSAATEARSTLEKSGLRIGRDKIGPNNSPEVEASVFTRPTNDHLGPPPEPVRSTTRPACQTRLNIGRANRLPAVAMTARPIGTRQRPSRQSRERAEADSTRAGSTFSNARAAIRIKSSECEQRRQGDGRRPRRVARLVLRVRLLGVGPDREQVRHRHVAGREDRDGEARRGDRPQAPAEGHAEDHAPGGQIEPRGFFQIWLDRPQAHADDRDDPGEAAHRVDERRARPARQERPQAQRLRPAGVAERAEPGRRDQRHRHERRQRRPSRASLAVPRRPSGTGRTPGPGRSAARSPRSPARAGPSRPPARAAGRSPRRGRSSRSPAKPALNCRPASSPRGPSPATASPPRRPRPRSPANVRIRPLTAGGPLLASDRPSRCTPPSPSRRSCPARANTPARPRSSRRPPPGP